MRSRRQLPGAGRADQPPGHRLGRGAGGRDRALRRHRHRRLPRPLLPRPHLRPGGRGGATAGRSRTRAATAPGTSGTGRNGRWHERARAPAAAIGRGAAPGRPRAGPRAHPAPAPAGRAGGRRDRGAGRRGWFTLGHGGGSPKAGGRRRAALVDRSSRRRSCPAAARRCCPTTASWRCTARRRIRGWASWASARRPAAAQKLLVQSRPVRRAGTSGDAGDGADRDAGDGGAGRRRQVPDAPDVVDDRPLPGRRPQGQGTADPGHPARPGVVHVRGARRTGTGWSSRTSAWRSTPSGACGRARCRAR